MPERSASTIRNRRTFAQQAFAILKMSVRAARNQFGSRLMHRKGLREATVGKGDRKILFPILFGLLMLGVASNSCYTGVNGLARHAQDQWPAESEGAKVIPVGVIEYFRLEIRSRFPPEQTQSDEARERDETKLAEAIRQHSHVDEEAAKARARDLLTHLEKHGIEGFIRKNSANLYEWVNLRELSPEAATWFGRVLALIIGCLFVSLVFMPLSARNKDLGSADAQLAWLFCLPLSGREILSGRFISMVFVKPLTWILLWPLFTILFIGSGYGVVSIVCGWFASLTLSVATAGIELMAETWLRARGSFKLKKNVQSLATIVSTLAFLVAASAGVASAKSPVWINWILDHLPDALTVEPGKLLLLARTGTSGLWTLLGILALGAGSCGFIGLMLAANSLRRGLSSGNERSGVRSAGAAIAAKSTRLVKFERLLLLRDRNLATTLLVVPLMMVGYQFLINPEMLSDISAQKLAVIGFGCGIWAATMSAPHVMMSEANSLWIIFSLPVSIADHFQRRTRVWRAAGTVMAAVSIAVPGFWKGFPADGWWRVPAALGGVWVVSLVVYAIMMGKPKLPDATHGERPKIGIGRVYACMLIGGIVGGILWHGTAWQIVTTLVLWWFLGFGMWQGVAGRLQDMLEPCDPPERRITLSSAMFALIVFFMAQVIAAAVLGSMLPDRLPAVMLYSYVIGGLLSLGFCQLRSIDERLPAAKRVWNGFAGALLICGIVCIGFGAAWLAAIRHSSVLQMLFQDAESAAVIRLDPHNLVLILLAVVAAPILEETIFRGYVLRIMEGVWTTRKAIFANALLFAIVHPMLSFPPVFVLGLATAWLYTRTQKLWPGMVLHAVYNGAMCALQ